MTPRDKYVTPPGASTKQACVCNCDYARNVLLITRMIGSIRESRRSSRDRTSLGSYHGEKGVSWRVGSHSPKAHSPTCETSKLVVNISITAGGGPSERDVFMPRTYEVIQVFDGDVPLETGTKYAVRPVAIHAEGHHSSSLRPPDSCAIAPGVPKRARHRNRIAKSEPATAVPPALISRRKHGSSSLRCTDKLPCRFRLPAT